jgi:hypothetical protein
MHLLRYGIAPFLFTGLLAASCVCNADPVTERGLQHAAQGHATAERAITTVSKLVADSAPNLVPAWSQAVYSSVEQVPVYLVEGRPGTFVTPAAVPSGCRCVFVSPSVLEEWIRRNSTGPGRMALDAGQFLVFILLHEVGHLRKGNPGAVFRDGAMSQLNVEPSRGKVAEEEADDFAADLLKTRANQMPAGDVSLAANWVVTELSKLSWNMQAFRTLDEFGAFAVGKPSVYFDDGYSHPNLSWRILRVADRIQGSDSTRYMLETFEEARRRGADPRPL